MNRFIQFSQFIDERINKSASKEKPVQGRISKSAINKDNEFAPKTQDLTIKMPESPSYSKNKGGKITSLMHKIGTPPNQPNIHTF